MIKNLDAFETYFSGEQLFSETIEGELLPETFSIDDTPEKNIFFIDISLSISNESYNFDAHRLNMEMKNEWSHIYKKLCSVISEKLSMAFLKKEMNCLYGFMDKKDAIDVKHAIDLADYAKNKEDMIYSILNFLSRYHEIRMSELERSTTVNIDSNSLLVSMIKERNDYNSILNLSFLPDGKISFFSYDTDDDNKHSISGYMTQSGKYKHSWKIKSIFNILNRDEM